MSRVGETMMRQRDDWTQDVRTQTHFRWAAVVVCLCLVLGVPAIRAEFQNDQIGFDPAHVFAGSLAGENIDVLTGNLSLSIPLGPKYMLTDNFGYQVSLHYNSKVWDHDCEDVPSNQPCAGTWAMPTSYGLGFMPWFGRVYHYSKDKSYVYRYQSPDGAEHFFCYGSGSESDSTCTTSGHTTSMDTDRVLMNQYVPSTLGPGFS